MMASGLANGLDCCGYSQIRNDMRSRSNLRITFCAGFCVFSSLAITIAVFAGAGEVYDKLDQTAAV